MLEQDLAGYVETVKFANRLADMVDAMLEGNWDFVRAEIRVVPQTITRDEML